MSNQEPLYTAIAVNGACRRRPTILKLIINSKELHLNSLKTTQNQLNHNSKPSEA